MSYHLTYKQLLFDLYYAFECAKKNKRHKPYVIAFEKHLHDNLFKLCNELWEHKYKPQPSVCFIITHPKTREIFAANFRDRIVHHLYYNYTHQLYENTFIADSYSCIKNKGTHYGIHRLEKHIRQESRNYSKECYVLKMDIKGYFIHINRNKLLNISSLSLNSMKHHKNRNGKKWSDALDFDFIHYLNECIILNDPTVNCIFRSKPIAWSKLPKTKSLFHSNKDSGLPIGNLTSQLLSNVFLNVLDQYAKRELKCKHYGRYVDDFYVVSREKHLLREIVPLITQFLKKELDLDIHKGKTKIVNTKYGVDFLGAFIKPYRTYISNTTLKRIKNSLWYYDKQGEMINPINSINSYLGTFSHYKSYNLRVTTFCHIKKLYTYGVFTSDMRKFIPN